ncbi:MAG TPA: D-2-hydroxyacid dehydrogenase family protein [Frankiaceae bacterium]|jgi:phosphoglycerate dehydrogenase-like enzyme|nr:D-2-hydroxyacid dehydrogenase family protein [Frankiaceae bacterium]
MPTPRVAILDDYQGVALSCADWALDDRVDITVFDNHVREAGALVARLEPFEVIVAMRERTAFPESVLAKLPNLKLLITTGPFNAVIDVAAAQRLGIVVSGTGGAGAATPELAWALILGVTRGIAAEDAGLRAGRWQLGIGPELMGSTLGIVGLGRTGPRIAHYAHAFDMNVIAWSQNMTAEQAAASGAELVSKQELFERSDIVTIHLKLSERTTGIVGAAELAALGPRGYLVNTSRGPIVDEAALVAALHAGTIAGAALDVYDVEPLPADHPLLTAPNTLLTPHIGYVSKVAYAAFYRDVVEDIAAWLDGAPIRLVPA